MIHGCATAADAAPHAVGMVVSDVKDQSPLRDGGYRREKPPCVVALGVPRRRRSTRSSLVAPSSCSVPLWRSFGALSPSASPRRNHDLSLRVPWPRLRSYGARIMQSMGFVVRRIPHPVPPSVQESSDATMLCCSLVRGHAAPVSPLKGNISSLLS